MKRFAARAVIIALTLLLGLEAAAALPPTPITIGQSHDIASRPLGEHRTVNVVFPASYGREPARRYPVLYLIDGGVEQDLLHVSGAVQLGALWGRSAEAIVVGVETKDRRKELTGLTKDPELLARYPTAGSSGVFRAFIRDEVKPLVDRLYRTNGRNVILGESLAGLFVVETYLVEPGLFSAYGAIDPSLWWDKEALSRASAGLIGQAQKARPLLVAFAKEQSEEPAAMERLTAALHKKASPLCVMARPDLTHATIYQQITPKALQYLLPPADKPRAELGFSLKCSDHSEPNARSPG